MRITVSIPDGLHHSADAVARRLSISRNELCRRALEEFIAADVNARITERLNEVYADDPAIVDPVLWQMQAITHQLDSW
jgi:hypothetical protein